MVIPKNDENFGSILICAVRYALGRKTYMPSVVVDFITPIVRYIDSKTLAVISKEIKSAAKDNKLGDPTIDAPPWKSLYNACVDELQFRNEKIRSPKQEISNRVRYYRELKGLTQKELARMCGMQYQASISKIERGEVIPAKKTIELIGKALDVKSCCLIGVEETV